MKKSARKDRAVKLAVAGTLGLSLMYGAAQPGYASGLDAASTVIQGSGSGSVSESVKARPEGQESMDSGQMAKAKISKEQAEQTMRKLFPILQQAKLDSVTLENTNHVPNFNSGAIAWEMRWTISHKSNSSASFSTRVDAVSGEVLTYTTPYDREDNQSYYPPKVSNAEAEKIARQIIEKASGGKIRQAQLVQEDPNFYWGEPKRLFGPVRHHFSYHIKVNGIKSVENVQVTVDGNGEIRDYHRRPANSQYPAASAGIKQDEAEKLFKEQDKLVLHYVPADWSPANLHEKSKWMLAYVPSTVAIQLDAQSGKLIETPGFGNSGSVYADIPAATEVFKPHQGGQLTAEQAEETIKAAVAVPSDFTLSSQRLGEDYRGGKGQMWNLSWQKGQFMGENLNAVVDASTGEIRHFSFFKYPRHILGDTADQEAPKVKKTSVTEQQARDTALKLIVKLYPNAREELKLINAEGLRKADNSFGDQEDRFQYTFQSFYKGTPLLRNTVTVSLDADGKLSAYHNETVKLDGLGASLDLLTAKISEEAARSSYHAELKAELTYEAFIDGIKLIYKPLIRGGRAAHVIDAQTGEIKLLFNRDGGLGAEQTSIPADIEGHWANSQITTLINYGLLKPDPDGRIHPDSSIRYGDWMNMIRRGVYGEHDGYLRSEEKHFADVQEDSEFKGGVDFFVENSWLKANPGNKLNPGRTLTRGELSILLANMLKYGKLAEHMTDDVRIASLKDSDKIKNKGAAAIVSNLGLLTPSGGRFNPDAPVTKAQAAVVMMRLVELQGKTDTAILY
ncbi:YcdB/YcdC domain-containing protein [Paenibacillus pinihumi]|uniref:YcdB/YcdC domain-containing protein n=1 Tax=Paenibacillus pinihumi TaxID=669462 RepID=UPI0013781C32|nr:YcdB/YcdC domain-containing protein [Paenibacillus pinihumi]